MPVQRGGDQTNGLNVGAFGNFSIFEFLKRVNRIRRVRKNLQQAMVLAWTASPRLLMRFTLLGMFNAIMPPISVYLSARLVNVIAQAYQHATTFQAILPIILGLWITIVIQRALGAYIGYSRNLFVRRVELEAERRLLAKAATIDMGHFDNSDWYDRLSRAKRDVSWRPGGSHLVGAGAVGQYRDDRADGRAAGEFALAACRPGADRLLPVDGDRKPRHGQAL